MKKNMLLSAVAITILLGGCGDKKEEQESQHVEKIMHVTAQNPKTLFPKKKTTTPAVIPEVASSEAAIKTPIEVKTKETMPVSPEVLNQHAPTKEAHEAAAKEITASVSSVEKARAESASVIAEALTAVEVLDIEDDDKAHGVPSQLEHSKKIAAHTITQVVHEVEAAKAASAATIASSVKSVESAKMARSVSDPKPASVIQVVKAQSSAQVAKSVATVEIAKAKASGDMAKTVATVEMNKRLYGEGSSELAEAKAQAATKMAKSVGSVKIAEAKALADISKSVAAVEIASVETGIVKESVVNGQKYYLKEMKKPCGMNGAKFAAMHTQDEWEEIHNLGGFEKEAIRICPHIVNIQKEGLVDLYAFSYAYAKDSGSVPSCE